jgi:hypothetical protein
MEPYSPSVLQHKVEPGSPYCSDPDCKSCQDLRRVHQQIKTGKPLGRPADAPTANH